MDRDLQSDPVLVYAVESDGGHSGGVLQNQHLVVDSGQMTYHVAPAASGLNTDC